MSQLFTVRNVTHSYGKGKARTRVLADVSLDLHTGQVLAVVGRSGSGKSTLCHLMAGFHPPDDGSIWLNGRDVADVRDWTAVSVCPQRIGLAEEFTVAENVLLPCSVRDRPPLAGVLETLGLAEVADRAARETSLGEQQRTGVARALATSPTVAILDEPTGHQDDMNAQRVANVIALAQSQGTAVIVATHDARLLGAADDVLRIAGGRIVSCLTVWRDRRWSAGLRAGATDTQARGSPTRSRLLGPHHREESPVFMRDPGPRLGPDPAGVRCEAVATGRGPGQGRCRGREVVRSLRVGPPSAPASAPGQRSEIVWMWGPRRGPGEGARSMRINASLNSALVSGLLAGVIYVVIALLTGSSVGASLIGGVAVALVAVGIGLIFRAFYNRRSGSAAE